MAPGARADLELHWQHDFSDHEKRMLSAWVAETERAVEALVGPFPFVVHVYLHRREDAGEPVPWANTQRSRRQGVHLHVDPRFPINAFRQDWTAPHELSHLILPYLGRHDAWFAEGFASYLQYQVMVAMGVMTLAEAEALYLRNIGRAAASYRHADKPFALAAPRLAAERQYPILYWGGAAYFLQVDDDLRQTADASLIEVLRRYLACCGGRRGELDDLVAELDRVAGTPVFSQRLARFRTEPGFPEFRLPAGVP